ncbi:helix-turn-helix transcriptional regulator [Epilithonimonas hungarica]|uniref:helix-turn-helix transcriptional regulator n=1 Tax=Epilithonimonas hungarica TaxID=454006 RepID=UPI0011144D2D|nr:hypothetical protein [Epilithonimonas hungarica]MDP9956292.1 DNA-binding NarL/FixJ family response regulator [Epilithonimonas hungarica]MPT33324.1 hypothetical protein [Chryseobacterium sp.]
MIVSIAILLIAIIIILIFVLKKIRYTEFKINEVMQDVVLSQDVLSVDSYEEIISLARDNSSEFLFRFKEYYPSFIDKLLEIEPKLKTSELTFCAYLKLNFSTKDIATYTFVTPKAVQNRKNRIRKKLSIDSNIDIYVWFNNIK